MAATVSNRCSVIEFCERGRLFAPGTKFKMIYEADFLSGEKREKIMPSLSDGNYIFAIGAIWSDAKNRLQFLRECAPLLHAPLMFEEAIAEFEARPSEETINTISIPLIRAAGFRMTQDAICSTDPDVYRGGGEKEMIRVYMTALDSAVQKRLGKMLYTVLQSNQKIRGSAIIQKVIQVAKHSNSIKLPPAKWISVTQGREAKMSPLDQHEKLRSAFAEEIINGLTKILSE